MSSDTCNVTEYLGSHFWDYVEKLLIDGGVLLYTADQGLNTEKRMRIEAWEIRRNTLDTTDGFQSSKKKAAVQQDTASQLADCPAMAGEKEQE